MSADSRREHHSSRRHRSARSFPREQPKLSDEPMRQESELCQVPTPAHHNAQIPKSHQNDQQSSKRERRRSHRQRSHSSLASPPIETPITSVLCDLREDIEETNFSPQHSSTFYGALSGGREIGEDALVQGRAHGPVYVENRSGFSQISRERAFDHSDVQGVPFWGYWSYSDKRVARSENKPVHLAVSVQACWIPFATFCHGILAGVSLMQIIFVEIISSSTTTSLVQLVDIYGKISQLFSSLVYILVSLCLVSVFDRMDISHADCRNFFDVLSTKPRVNWLLVPLYSVALIVTFLAARTDDWLATRHFTNSSWTNNATEMSIAKTDLHMFEIWRLFNILRCACVVLGWFILASSRPKDLLLHHLKAMLRPPTPARIP